MSTRLDIIVRLILQEAKERKGSKGYSSKIYDVKLDVDLRIGMVLKGIQDREREQAAKGKGGSWQTI